MKAIFFDAGPVISLVMSRMDFILMPLKKEFGGKFYITPAVKKELIERPLNVKRFEFEALQVIKLFRDGVFEEYNDVPMDKVNELIELANSTFTIKNRNMDVIQSGEVESVAAALELDAAVVMDERTLRLFIENPPELRKLLARRFQKIVVANDKKMERFSKELKDVKIIRSIELAGLAFKLGILDKFQPSEIKNGREVLLESVLWATKTNGCAVTEPEIDEIKRYLLKQ